LSGPAASRQPSHIGPPNADQAMKVDWTAVFPIAVALVVAALVACSSGGDSPTTAPAEQPTSPSLTPTAERSSINVPEDAKNAALGNAVKLNVGEVAYYESEGLEMRFSAVIEDSRCPVSAQCIQAGRARVSIQLKTVTGDHAVISLEIDPLDDLRATKVLGVHTLTFLELEPYPGLETRDPDYEATLLVGRVPTE